jgi:hypothetical protein
MSVSARLIATAALLLLSASFLSAQETRGRFPEKMTVTVVDEAGKPIPHANGFHRFGQYVSYSVNEKGVFEIPMDEEKLKQWSTTDFTVKAEGYGPFSAHFDEDPIIPETFTVVLQPAQRIGGIVVDDDGIPVEGVDIQFLVTPITNYKVDRGLIVSFDIQTDAEGKWSFFNFPATDQKPYFSLKKEGFLQMGIGDIPAARLNPDAEGQYHEKIMLERGYVFSGKVIDETGTPIEGVTLQFSAWDSKPITSDKEGNFRFENCQLTDRMLLTAFVPGKASQALLVEIRSENEPLEIVMKPGRKLTFNVTDSAGKPLKDIWATVAGIDGLPGSHLRMETQFLGENNKTDNDGRLVWNDGPDTFCDIV